MEKKEKLTSIINVRFSETEFNSIVEDSKRNGITNSENIRKHLLYPNKKNFIPLIIQRNFFINLINNTKIAPKTKESMLKEVDRFDFYNY